MISKVQGRELTAEEQLLIRQWILENVDASVVPGDEGNDRGLIWNMIGLLYHSHPYNGTDGYEPYRYRVTQDEKLNQWSKEVKRDF